MKNLHVRLLFFISILFTSLLCANAQFQKSAYSSANDIDTYPISGMAKDSAYLWLATSKNCIYKISVERKAIIDSLEVEVPYLSGLALVNNKLFGIDVVNNRLCKFDTITGALLNEVALPFGEGGGFASGMDWDNEFLYINYINETDSVFVIDTLGDIVNSWENPVSTPTGILVDYWGYWYIDSEASSLKFQNSKGNLIWKDFEAPGGQFPTALAFDYRSIWIANNDFDIIVKMDTMTGELADTIELRDRAETSFYDQEESVGNLCIWPTVADDFVILDVSGEIEKNQQFRIISLSGGVVVSGKIQQHVNYLSISDLPKGAYIVQLEGKRDGAKFIKQ